LIGGLILCAWGWKVFVFFHPLRLSHATVASDLHATGTSPASAPRAGEAGL